MMRRQSGPDDVIVEGMVGLLGILLIALKLTHVIECGWLWVLAPFWMPLAIFLMCVLIAFLCDLM